MFYNMSTDTLESIIIGRHDIIDISVPLVITIPAEIDFRKVFRIGNDMGKPFFCFESDVPHPMLKKLAVSLIISEGTEEISKSAFAADEHLQSLTIPASLTTIGDKAFQRCKVLKKVIVPEDSKLEHIGSSAFCHAGVQEFKFPKSIKHIGNKAFDYSSIQNVNLSEAVGDLTIGTSAFSHCKVESVTFPKKLKKLGNFAFSDSRSLKTVSFPMDCKLTTIPKHGFSSCYELKTVTLGHNCTEIKERAFSCCLALQEINLEDTQVKELEQDCFSSCEALEEVSFPKTLTSLGSFCFCLSAIQKADLSNIQHLGAGCFLKSKIQEVILPAYETYEPQIFSGCSELYSVKFTGEEKVSRITLSFEMFCSTPALKSFTFPKKLAEIDDSAFVESGIDVDI